MLYSDMLALTYPSQIEWGSGELWLVNVYDWDEVLVSKNTPSLLTFNLVLCTQFFPCKLSIVGNASGNLIRAPNSSLACFLSLNCSALRLQNINFLCNGSQAKSTIVIQGSTLDILNVSFSDCWAFSDGGAINSYDQAYVSVQSSRFQNLRSETLGGAIAAVGSRVTILNSEFINCSASQGGGALWATSFPGCYGSFMSMGALIEIKTSLFRGCSTGGMGGAILAFPGPNSVNDIKVYIHIAQTIFLQCRSSKQGGAISATYQTELALDNAEFYNNCADGYGGGALHLQNAFFADYQSVFVNNTAPSGGGGVLYWESSIHAARWYNCSPGSSAMILLQDGENEWLSCSDQISVENHTTTTSNIGVQAGTSICYSSYSNLNESAKIELEQDSKYLDQMRCHCGYGNRAKYGPCIASDYKRLALSNVPLNGNAAYAGISFAFLAVKVDAYNQTIFSDSVSLLQAFPYSDIGAVSETYLIVGSTLSRFLEGSALFSFSITPSFQFRYLEPGLWTTKLLGTPSLFLDGVDQQTNTSMQSDSFAISFWDDGRACPLGYVLSFDTSVGFNGSSFASCKYCPPGTYSIDPLGGYESPSCLNCPAGATCSTGGSDIIFGIGNWSVSQGMYILYNCPSQHMLINATDGSSKGQFSHDAQQCKPCGSSEYIVKPNTDQCMPCPKGAQCPSDLSCALRYPLPFVCPVGDRIIGIWEVNMTMGTFILKECPLNYTLISTSEAGSAELQRCSECPIGSYTVHPDTQSCQTCPKGALCSDLSCALRNPPSFLCPHDEVIGTWVVENSSSTYVLENCPSGYTLVSTAKAGSPDLQQCKLCSVGEYIVDPAKDDCQPCPKGATCPDLSCALTNGPSFACSYGESILGSWVVFDSTYILINCPSGTSLLNSTVGTSRGTFSAQIQQCRPCPSDTYIIDPNHDECQPCPPGLLADMWFQHF